VSPGVQPLLIGDEAHSLLWRAHMGADREHRRNMDQESGLNGHTPLLPKVVQGVKSADDKLVTFVRERPLVAVGAALLVGYMLGRVLTRID